MSDISFNARILGAEAQRALGIVRSTTGEPSSPSLTERALVQIITLTRAGDIPAPRRAEVAAALDVVLADPDARLVALQTAFRNQAAALQALIAGPTAPPVEAAPAARPAPAASRVRAKLSPLPAITVNPNRVAVMGAGKMGSDIAYALLSAGFDVVVYDSIDVARERSQGYIAGLIEKGLANKKIKPAEAEAMRGRLTYVITPHEAVANTAYVMEAIFENFEAKAALFEALNLIASPETVFMTNTSTISVNRLAAASGRPDRFMGAHFFWPAYQNSLLEITASDDATSATQAIADAFGARLQKVVLHTPDIPGFVANRFFVPWLNEAAKLLNELEFDNAEVPLSLQERRVLIDHVARDTFHVGMGPFALMNATGPVIAYDSAKSLATLGGFYAPAPYLSELTVGGTDGGNRWLLPKSSLRFTAAKADIAGQEVAILAKVHDVLGEKYDIVRGIIRDRLLATSFRVAATLVAEHGIDPNDVDMAARVGLAWPKGPFEMMNEIGLAEAERLSDSLAIEAIDPTRLFSRIRHLLAMPLSRVNVEYAGPMAVIRIAKPEKRNALDPQVIADLRKAFTKAERNADVKTIVLQGVGGHLAAGADLGFFADNLQANRSGTVLQFASDGQELLDQIDRSKKRVVAAIDGFALGGGLELALAADTILATPRSKLGLPEAGLGIVPGLMGGMRLARHAGSGTSFYWQATARQFSGQEAADMGLVHLVQPEGIASTSALEKTLKALPPYRYIKEEWAVINGAFSTAVARLGAIDRRSAEEVVPAPITFTFQARADGTGTSRKGEGTHQVTVEMPPLGLREVYTTAVGKIPSGRIPASALRVAERYTGLRGNAAGHHAAMLDDLALLFSTPFAVNAIARANGGNIEPIIVQNRSVVEWYELWKPAWRELGEFATFEDRGPELVFNFSVSDPEGNKTSDLIKAIWRHANALDQTGQLAQVAQVRLDIADRDTDTTTTKWIYRYGVGRPFVSGTHHSRSSHHHERATGGGGGAASSRGLSVFVEGMGGIGAMDMATNSILEATF